MIPSITYKVKSFISQCKHSKNKIKGKWEYILLTELFKACKNNITEKKNIENDKKVLYGNRQKSKRKTKVKMGQDCRKMCKATSSQCQEKINKK